MREPKIFILSGPSGAGKTTLLDKLFHNKSTKNSFLRGISFTTRAKRPQEANGKDYFFVNKEELLKLKKRNFFLEHQKVLENYYGTPKYFYVNAKKEKKDLILCIDVKGGMYLKKKHRAGRIITIFVRAPNKKELKRRLKQRVEQKDSIVKRVSLAKKELQFSKYYDYVMVNQDLQTSVKILEDIFLANENNTND
ncbi:MAG: guanylate kinase [Candidatus Omnitrophota bacterium]|nr:guanylate kinase [Candidatus Omnitrophota bacterium]